jgi:transposase
MVPCHRHRSRCLRTFSAQAALLTEREARLRSEAERDAAVADAANARARLSSTEALIAYL